MLVKLWDTKAGKVLFTLDSHEGKEDFFFNYLQPNIWHGPISQPLLLLFFFHILTRP